MNLSAAAGIKYGDEIWRTDPSAAFDEAQRRIRATLADKSCNLLYLSDLSALEELPDSIAECCQLTRLSLGDDLAPDGKVYSGNGHLGGSGIQLQDGSKAAVVYVEARRLAGCAPVSGLDSLEHLNCDFTDISDLTPLSGLSSLQSLTCSHTQVIDLTPLSGLSSLQSLTCSHTQVIDLTPLSGLSSLQRLDCSHTEVIDLTPLSGLSSLQWLDCSETRVVDLTPLSGLSSLQWLNCSGTEVIDLTPLSGLSSLQGLDCSGTEAIDLTPLSGLSSLQGLDCSGTEAIDLTPLSGLSRLQGLDCSHTQVIDLTPLSGLSSLQSLACSYTQVVDLTPLSGLSSLQSLACSYTQVVDLTPLSGLSSLQGLDCSGTEAIDLTPLSGLSRLQGLDCSHTQVIDLTPLSGLSSLQSLACSYTQVVDLTPLSGLSSLQGLNCSSTEVIDLTPLSGLSSLQSLMCSHIQVIDLTPLSGLSSLQSLTCWRTQVIDLTPLSGLSSLQRLDCSHTEVIDLTPLSGLSSLQGLNCSSTEVIDLTPLSGLSSLQSLDCSSTQVIDLTPLSGLSSLQSLACSYTQVVDLTPLSGLSSLQELDCSHTEIIDLTPLSGLSRLQGLDCSETRVVDLTPLSGLSSLQSLDCSILDIQQAQPLRDLLSNNINLNLSTYRMRVRGIPDEVFSTNFFENCADRVRAHFSDLGDDPQPLDTVKLIALGNGRIGKTQICNRLRSISFDTDADSTHGIKLFDAPIPAGQGTFRIWDFGGQEIYHGTHALFLRSRAVFMLVWTPDTDNSNEDIPAHGLQFRNRPVGWWLDIVLRFGGAGSPLIVVQNQIDREGDYDRGDHPDLAPLRSKLSYCRALAMSALTKQGLPSLKDALSGAADCFNPPLIGRGRLAVMQKLRAMLTEDLDRPSAAREHRTLSMAEFHALCERTGGISNPEQFLSFLHNAGEVFWNHRSAEHSIILDQAWALEAIYAIYERQRCWTNLLHSRGRFTRHLMGSFLWDKEGYSDEEQRVFINFMCESGICFQVSGREEDDTAVYIAPDALPEHLDGEQPQPLESPDALHCYWFPDIAPGFMRALLVALGRKAGINGTYWRTGFAGFSRQKQAHIQVEEIYDPDKGNGLRLSAKGRGAMELVGALGKLSETTMQLFNMTPDDPTPKKPEEDHEMDYAPNPDAPKSFFVSYAWGDKDNPNRDQIVDAFCKRAEAEGVHIRRDRDEVMLGQRISEFMAKLVRGDRILIVLSDKYLRSVPCMTELYQIWHYAGHDPAEFLSKVRLFTAPDAKIFDPVGRALIGKHWHDEYERQEPVLAYMGDKDRVAHNQLKRFHTHVPEILELISDILQPRSLDDLVTYALD